MLIAVGTPAELRVFRAGDNLEVEPWIDRVSLIANFLRKDRGNDPKRISVDELPLLD